MTCQIKAQKYLIFKGDYWYLELMKLCTLFSWSKYFLFPSVIRLIVIFQIKLFLK